MSGNRIPAVLVLLATCALLGTLVLPLARATFPGTDGQIIFVNVPDAPGSIIRINPDGSGLTQITQGLQVLTAAVSPDGTTIAFDVLQGAICTVPINGGDAIMIPGSADVPGANPEPGLPVGVKEVAWTPDGASIVFTCDTGLCVIPATGGSPSAISGTVAEDSVPDIKPDGSEIAFDRNVSGTLQIHTIPIGGGSVTQRTDCPSGGECSKPTYSPDGATIGLDASVCSGAIGIIASNATLATPTCFLQSNTEDTSPAFSPEGGDILVEEQGDPLQTLAKFDIAGASRTNIYTGRLRDPKWGAVAAGGAGGAGGTTPCPSGAGGSGGRGAAPEALCGKIFFGAQKKAEGAKAKAIVKFVKAGCFFNEAEEIGDELEEKLAPIVRQANAAIERNRIGGSEECDPELQARLPVDLTDLLDGAVSGEDFLQSDPVEDTCDEDIPDL